MTKYSHSLTQLKVFRGLVHPTTTKIDYRYFLNTTDQYRHEMLRKFGSQLNIKNHLMEFPTVGQNNTKCKLNLEIKGNHKHCGRTIFFRRWSHCCCYVKLSAGLLSAADRIRVNKTCFIVC